GEDQLRRKAHDDLLGMSSFPRRATALQGAARPHVGGAQATAIAACAEERPAVGRTPQRSTSSTSARKPSSPSSELLGELLDFVDEAAELLGTRDELRSAISSIFREGTSADRQLKVYQASGMVPKKVVDHLIQE